MEKLSKILKENEKYIQDTLKSDDIITYSSSTNGGIDFDIFYVDSMIDKNLLGQLVTTRLLDFSSTKTLTDLKNTIANPETEEVYDFEELFSSILNGNAIVILDGFETALTIGITDFQMRTIQEPPSEINIKGPREGFIENIKTNQSLVRRRLKNKSLVFKNLVIGKQSQTNVSLCYIDGISNEKILQEVENKLKKIEIDNIADSSYLTKYLSNRPFSIFKQIATTEKPDVFAGKIVEGRIGILVDGSPIALTVPYILVEDFQSPEDYFVSPYRANATRFLRVFAVIIAILLPAFYVSAQLFKIELIPLGLLLTIASGIKGIPLSPSLEMFFTLLIFEILNEASIRMPKYVGQALAIVGALVLGETAVRAGIISTPAIIIIALSGICLYTVPDLIETTSLLRLLFLIVAGSVGTYGVVAFIAFLTCYVVCTDNFGVPITAPYSPYISEDMNDALTKNSLFNLSNRPVFLNSKNKTRLVPPKEKR